MGRLRLLLFAWEFWFAIAAFIPAIISVGWLVFKDYFIAQNEFLKEFKVTIDTAALLVAIASVVVGYLSLMSEINKLKKSSKQPNSLKLH
jgi:hypothetical protein